MGRMSWNVSNAAGAVAVAMAGSESVIFVPTTEVMVVPSTIMPGPDTTIPARMPPMSAEFTTAAVDPFVVRTVAVRFSKRSTSQVARVRSFANTVLSWATWLPSNVGTGVKNSVTVGAATRAAIAKFTAKGSKTSNTAVAGVASNPSDLSVAAGADGNGTN